MRRPDYDRRVAVTGLGIISPVGNSVESAWHNLVNGVSGLKRITRWDPEVTDCHAAGEVNDFDPKEWMNFKAVRRTDMNVVFGVAAAKQAMTDSGFEITDFLSSKSDFAVSVDRAGEHFPSSGQGSSFVLVEGDLTSPDALAALDDAVGMLDASSADFGRNGGGELIVLLHAGDLVQMTLEAPAVADAVVGAGADLTDGNGDGYPDSPAAIRAVYDYIAEAGVPTPDGGVALAPDEVSGVIADDGGTGQATALTVMVGSFTDGEIIVPVEQALDAAARSIEQAVPGLEASVSGEVLTSYHGLAAFTRSMVVSLPLAILLTAVAGVGFLMLYSVSGGSFSPWAWGLGLACVALLAGITAGHMWSQKKKREREEAWDTAPSFSPDGQHLFFLDQLLGELQALRVRHGQYLINPELALRVEGDWRRIYELLSLDRLAGQLRDPLHWADQVWDLNADRQRAIEALRTLLKALNDGGGVSEPF